MSETLDTAASSQAASAVASIHWLIEADFTVGMQYWTTWPVNVTVDGNTYVGAGAGVVTVGPVREAQDTNTEKLKVSLNVVNSALVVAAMADPAGYRDRRISLYGQFFDETLQPKGAKVLRWSGRMDKVAIERKPSDPSGEQGGGSIELQCTRAGMARARLFQGLRLTSAQHKSRFPDDEGLSRMQNLIEKPVPWLSIAFQRI